MMQVLFAAMAVVAVLGPPIAFCIGVYLDRNGRTELSRGGYFAIIAALLGALFGVMFVMAKINMGRIRQAGGDVYATTGGDAFVMAFAAMIVVVVFPAAYFLGRGTRQRLRSAKSAERIAYPLSLFMYCPPLYVLLCIPGGGSYQPAKQLTEELSLDHYNQRRKNDYQA